MMVAVTVRAQEASVPDHHLTHGQLEIARLRRREQPARWHAATVQAFELTRQVNFSDGELLGMAIDQRHRLGIVRFDVQS